MGNSVVAAPARPNLWQRLRPVLLSADAFCALAAFFGALAIYLPTLSPSVVSADGGELQMLTGILGISHPTGYPLLILLNRLFASLPLGGDLAHRVTLLGTLFTAGTVVAMYFMLREVGARPVAALSGAWLVAAAPRLWMHAAAAEVYPLSEFLIILGLWLLIRWGNGRVPLWAPMLALGFGLSHHVSVRLLGPAVLVYLLVVEPRLPLAPRKWLPALVVLLLPLAFYVYLPLRFAYFSSLPEYSGEVLGIPKLIAGGFVNPHYYARGPIGMFLGTSYSGFFQGGIAIGAPAARGFLEMLRLQFPLLAAPVMLLGLAVLFRKHWCIGLLVVLSAGVTLLVALRWLTIIGEDGDHFIPVYMLLAFCFGVGVEAIMAWVEQRLPGRKWVSWLLAVAVLALPLYSAVTTFPSMLVAREDRKPNLLTPDIPSGAVIAGVWEYITPLRYQQRIENVRPDLWVLHADAAGVTMLANRAIDAGVPFYQVLSGPKGLQRLPIPLRDEAAIRNPAPADQQK
ncbi:MAG: protein O-mannosyl-transferase family, partial [Nitrososphaerales archaeon]